MCIRDRQTPDAIRFRAGSQGGVRLEGIGHELSRAPPTRRSAKWRIRIISGAAAARYAQRRRSRLGIEAGALDHAAAKTAAGLIDHGKLPWRRRALRVLECDLRAAVGFHVYLR